MSDAGLLFGELSKAAKCTLKALRNNGRLHVI